MSHPALHREHSLRSGVIAPVLLVAGLLSACADTDDRADAETPRPAEVTAPMPEAADALPDTAPENNATEDDIVVSTPTVRAAESHVHGGATLALALDGGELVAELDTPLYNLLGFEHAPETDAQREAVRAAEAALGDARRMVAVNPEAGCSALPPEPVRLFNSADSRDHGHGHDGEHDGGDHDDRHDDGQSDGHGDGSHSHGDADHSGHRDVLVSYSYSCGSPSELSRVSVGVLDAFPLIDELDVVYLGPDTQRSFSLSQGSTTIDLGRP